MKLSQIETIPQIKDLPFIDKITSFDFEMSTQVNLDENFRKGCMKGTNNADFYVAVEKLYRSGVSELINFIVVSDKTNNKETEMLKELIHVRFKSFYNHNRDRIKECKTNRELGSLILELYDGFDFYGYLGYNGLRNILKFEESEETLQRLLRLPNDYLEFRLPGLLCSRLGRLSVYNNLVLRKINA